MTDLQAFIEQSPLIDSHEHLRKEAEFVGSGPDILQDLFGNYVSADLRVAGASQEAVDALLDSSNPDIAGRFEGVREAWERCQFTGYGEAVRTIAAVGYGIDEITAEALGAAAPRATANREPGNRLRILRERANLDHVQIDDFCWPCLPDESGPDFFLYDLSWLSFCNGDIQPQAIFDETGVEVRDLASLNAAMEAIFEKYGSCAVAVKAQHAYNRTLKWGECDDMAATSHLDKVLAGRDLVAAQANALGDWCWAKGVELAIRHNLPFKIHTGYYAGHSGMPVDRIRSGHLCKLLQAYPQARFVLMHIAYPYSNELIALAKHYPNVYVDLCWAWSIDPYSSMDFVRRLIHAVPSNKLFGFGGDTSWPNAALAYSLQARKWLNRTLQAEVDDGYLTELEAIGLARRFMLENQRDCFDIEGTRAAIHRSLQDLGSRV